MQSHQILVKNKLEEGKLFKASRFKEAIKKTRPHKHDGYFELIFISEGEGFHTIEDKNYKISAPEIYFMKPDQLHCWQFTAIPKGFVVLFKDDFFDPITESPILQLIKKLGQVTRVPLPGTFDPLYLFEEISKEYQNTNAYSPGIIHGYLRSIFSKLLQFSNSTGNDVKDHLYEKFLKLLPHHCPQLHQVSQFAGLLHTSPQNLNAACRRHTSKSAGEHIAGQIILEAKRYILHTDMNVNEIADALHFNDASYFVKYFKKNAGITPLQFRARYFQ